MHKAPALAYYSKIHTIAMAVGFFLSCLLPPAIAADEAEAASSSQDKWFVFLGGRAGNPVWTVSHGRRLHDFALPCYHEVPALEPIVGASLGVQAIVIPADILSASKLVSSSIHQDDGITGQAARIEEMDAEGRCSMLLRGVRRLSSKSDDLVLELLPPLSAMFGEGYLCKYATRKHQGLPIVLSVSRRSADAKSRLCGLTRQLMGIAKRLEQSVAKMRDVNPRTGELTGESASPASGRDIKAPGVDLIPLTGMAEIETAWLESIFRPYVEHLALVPPLRVHVWESMSTIEIDFPEEVDFAAWAEVIAGALLGVEQGQDPLP